MGQDFENVRRILIRSVNWIGDAVMTTPAIGLVRRHFPEASITLLANPMVSELFARHVHVDRVITFDRNGAHKGILGRFRLARELRDASFDLAVILPNSFDSALVPWLAGIPARLGKSHDGRSFMLTGCYRPEKGLNPVHEVDDYLEMLKHFGITGAAGPLLLCTTPEEELAAGQRLREHGIMPDDYIIGINPGATYGSAKRWYPERFAEAADILAAEWGARVVIFGGPGEAAISGEIERLLAAPCCNVAGKTTVRELMALIRRCNMFVTNDSGPMHIAAAFGVPLVAVFGSTDHATTSPYGGNALIVRKDVECSPCKLRECPTDHRCMTEVAAIDVVIAARQLRNQISGTP